MTKPVVFTCEHGGYGIPPAFMPYFMGRDAILQSHRGWDSGALDLARYLASAFSAPLEFSGTSRLLIDLNRSLHHRQLFSEFTHSCDKKTREYIIDHYYLPYRTRVEKLLNKSIEKHGLVIHFSIHSFTPRLDNYRRKTDIGLLYDPRRKQERKSCMELQGLMLEMSRQWTVRRNYPYRGTADGFTTFLRKQYDEKIYSGIEIEINQKFVGRRDEWRDLSGLIGSAIRKLLDNNAWQL